MAERHAVATEVPRRQLIVPTGQRLGYPESTEVVARLFRDEGKGAGKLPSHTLHDDILVKLWDRLTEDEKSRLNKYYPGWAREILVYPAPNGRFKKGKDIEDSLTDNQWREWIFPASSIPYEAIGMEKVGLFVDPNHIEFNFQRVVIMAQPESVIIHTKFLQKAGWGVVDQKTRLPFESDLDGVPNYKRRYLSRIRGVGVRPLSRHGDIYSHGRRGIIAGRRIQEANLGVAVVETDETLPNVLPSLRT